MQRSARMTNDISRSACTAWRVLKSQFGRGSAGHRWSPIAVIELLGLSVAGRMRSSPNHTRQQLTDGKENL